MTDSARALERLPFGGSYPDKRRAALRVRALLPRALAIGVLAGLAAGYALAAYEFSPLAVPAAIGGLALVVAGLRVPWLGVAAALALSPLELASLSVGTIAISPSEALLASVGIGWLARLALAPDEVVKPGLRDLPFAALLAIVALGLTFAQDPAPIARVLLLWSLVYFAYLQVQSFDTASVRRLIGALAIGGGVLGLTATIEFIGSGDPGLFAGGAGADLRVAGSFSGDAADSNYLAAYLQLAALPAIALLAYRLSRNAWLLPAAIAASAGILLSLSRGGTLGFAAGLLLMLLLWPRARWIAAGLTVLVAALTVAGANPLVGSQPLATVEQRLSSLADAETEVNPRRRLYQASTDLAVEHPLAGIGINQFQGEAARRGVTQRGEPFENAHNMYLGLAAETGIVGLALFLAFLGQIAWRSARLLRRLDGVEAALALGIAAGLLGFALQGMTVSLTRHNLLWGTFLVLAGSLTALDRQLASRAGPTARPPEAAAAAARPRSAPPAQLR